MKEEENKEKDLFGHTIVPIGLGFLVAALVTKFERIMEEKKTNGKILPCSLIMKFVETGTSKSVKRAVKLADYRYEVVVVGSFCWLLGGSAIRDY